MTVLIAREHINGNVLNTFLLESSLKDLFYKTRGLKGRSIHEQCFGSAEIADFFPFCDQQLDVGFSVRYLM